MRQSEKLLEVAYAQVGVTEDPPGSNLTKYGAAYGWNGVAWCCIFVWWCFREAKLAQYFYNGNKTASCTSLMKWAANAGQFVVGGFRQGDVFLYDYDGIRTDSEHTGIFTGIMEGDKYLVIEGNYGDKVAIVARKPAEIIGAFRPAFEDEDDAPDPPEDPTVEITLPELEKGDRSRSVRAMQILLEGNGHSVGRWGCDGDFGNDTRKALLDFQKAAGLDADGICGEQTWGRLLGVK